MDGCCDGLTVLLLTPATAPAPLYIYACMHVCMYMRIYTYECAHGAFAARRRHADAAGARLLCQYWPARVPALLVREAGGGRRICIVPEAIVCGVTPPIVS